MVRARTRALITNAQFPSEWYLCDSLACVLCLSDDSCSHPVVQPNLPASHLWGQGVVMVWSLVGLAEGCSFNISPGEGGTQHCGKLPFLKSTVASKQTALSRECRNYRRLGVAGRGRDGKAEGLSTWLLRTERSGLRGLLKQNSFPSGLHAFRLFTAWEQPGKMRSSSFCPSWIFTALLQLIKHLICCLGKFIFKYQKSLLRERMNPPDGSSTHLTTEAAGAGISMGQIRRQMLAVTQW